MTTAFAAPEIGSTVSNLVRWPTRPVRPAAGMMGRLGYHVLRRGLVPPGPDGLEDRILSQHTPEEAVGILSDIFSAQLGQRWVSFAGASTPTRALLLRAAACFLNRPLLDGLDAGLLAMMRKPPSENGDLEHVESVLGRYLHHTDLIEWIDRFGEYHAFERPLVVGMVDWVTRKKGVLPFKSWDLPWLAYVDRVAWLALDFRGSLLFPFECAGVFSHFMSERRVGEAMSIPQTQAAVEGFLDSRRRVA